MAGNKLIFTMNPRNYGKQSFKMKFYTFILFKLYFYVPLAVRESCGHRLRVPTCFFQFQKLRIVRARCSDSPVQIWCRTTPESSAPVLCLSPNAFAFLAATLHPPNQTHLSPATAGPHCIDVTLRFLQPRISWHLLAPGPPTNSSSPRPPPGAICGSARDRQRREDRWLDQASICYIACKFQW
jgi:hypothetical protein